MNCLDKPNDSLIIGITEEQHKRIADAAEQAVVNFIAKLPRLIEEVMTRNIFLAFGMEKSTWDRWEINKTNGANPMISQWVSSRAMDICQKVVAKLEWHPDEAQIAAMVGDLKERATRNIREELYKKSREMTEKALDGFITPPEVKKIRAVATKELIHDPQYGTSPLQKLFLLQALVKDGMATEADMNAALNQMASPKAPKKRGKFGADETSDQHIDESSGHPVLNGRELCPCDPTDPPCVK